jgi:hypothetical protein
LEESSLFIEKMFCKTEYAYCSLRDRQSELMTFVSAIAYRPTSLPFLNDPKDSTLDSPSFTKKCLVHSLRKCSQIPKSSQPLTLIHMDNARVHAARITHEKLEVSRFKCTPQPPYSPDIAPHNVSLFDWLKTQLERREYNGEDEL